MIGAAIELAIRELAVFEYKRRGIGSQFDLALNELMQRTLAGVRHVDHHAHSILRAGPRDLDAFRGLFSESADPRQWPHVATTITYQRAVELLALELG